MRVMTVLHVSLVGAFMELSPFFVFPFEILLQSNYYKKWEYILPLIVVSHIIFIIALKLVYYFVKKETLKIFRVLIHRNEEEEVEAESKNGHSNESEIPSFASGNVVSGLRIMSSYYGDPQFFSRFALVQHRSGVRASSMLEIIRFLAIFPSKRVEMLKELKSLKSNSNYNRFMIYFFTKVLNSLIDPCDKSCKEALNFYQRAFIVHNHYFWIARRSKKYFVSLIEACSTAYYFSEFKSEIQMLITRFPFDSTLYRRFGDFLLLASGDYENYVFCEKFADSIENKEVNLTDCLIHRYINVNPRILSYLNDEEYKSSSVNDQIIIQNKIFQTFGTSYFSSTYKSNTNTNGIIKRRRKTNLSANSTANESLNVDYSINSDFNVSSVDNLNSAISPLATVTSNTSLQGDSSLLNANDAAGTNDEQCLEIPVASYIQISNRCIPFFPFINNIIVSILLLVFLFRIIPLENRILNNFSAISLKKPQLLRFFVDAGNAIMFPFSVAYQEESNIRSSRDYNQFKMKHKLKYVDLNGQFNSNFPDINYFCQTARILRNENVSTFYMNYNSFEINVKSHKQEDILTRKNFEIPRIRPKSDNDTLTCQLQYSMMLDNVIDFFNVISQLRNLTDIMVLHISKSARQISENEYSMCGVLKLFYDSMIEFPIISMAMLEGKLKEVIEDFQNLYDRIDLFNFTLTNLLVYMLVMVVFIALYLLLMLLQINLTMKGQNKAVSFLCSRERLESLLCQKTEESWDALTLFMPTETVRLLNLREYCDVIDQIQCDDSSSQLDLIFNDRPNNDSNFSKSETSSIDEFEEKYEEAPETEKEIDITRLFTMASPLVREYGQNVLLSNRQAPLKVMSLSPHNRHERRLSDISITSSSSKEKGRENENEIEIETEKVTHKSESENEIEIEFDHVRSNLDRHCLEDQVDFTLRSTAKETKNAWLQVFLFVISPWLIMAVSMCLLVYPIYSHTDLQRSLATTALSEGRQLFACFELVQATSDYLFDKRKNVTQFRKIHDVLSSWPEPSSPITSYSSQISEYYFREQCMQLLGITCTSIATLVQEVIDTDVDSGRLTFLILPAFIRFGRTVLEDLFFPESEYVEEMSMISESSFIVVLCMLTLGYLAATFHSACFDVVEGFNSLFHFPERRLVDGCDDDGVDKNKSEVKNKDDFTSLLLKENEVDLNKVMWSIYGQKTGEKLPSTVVFIASLIKNDEIYSISDNVENLFNRQPTSFIGQKLNECFPIVPENIQLRQFFMPDYTKKVFHFSTKADKNGWLNLTFMIENDHFNSKKSYKEDTIVEKLMHFIPPFFAKSFSTNSSTSLSTSPSSIQKFEYINPIVIFLRFDSSLPAMLLEQYFSIVNAAVMNFTSIKAILADGCMFVFTTVKQVNPIVPFLFARDLIEESKKPKRGKPTNGTISILIEKIGLVTAEISHDDMEPFLETSLEKVELKKKEKILFMMDRDQIALEADFEQILPGITKDTNVEMNDGNNDDFIFFSFTKFLSNLNCLI